MVPSVWGNAGLRVKYVISRFLNYSWTPGFKDDDKLVIREQKCRDYKDNVRPDPWALSLPKPHITIKECTNSLLQKGKLPVNIFLIWKVIQEQQVSLRLRFRQHRRFLDVLMSDWSCWCHGCSCRTPLYFCFQLLCFEVLLPWLETICSL